jgi:pyruvate ferredoxin oxidoreductase alpha subunit
MRKISKAQWYAQREGMVYGKVLSFCPLNWRTQDDAAQEVLQAAVDCCFFPVYEVEKGHTTITYDPDAIGRRRAVADWLGMMGKTKHIMTPEHADQLAATEAEVETRWQKLKIKHEHPEL